MTLFRIAQATQPTFGRRHNPLSSHGSGLILLPQPPPLRNTLLWVNTILSPESVTLGRFSPGEFPNCIMEPFQQYSTLPEVVSPRDAELQGEYRPPVCPKTSYSESTPTISSVDPISQTPSFSRHHSLPPMLCCVCNGPSKAWKCVQCDDFFCGECWPKERPHRVSNEKFVVYTLPVLIKSSFRLFVVSYLLMSYQPGKVGIDGRQHEMVDEDIVRRLQQIFGQPSAAEQHRRHTNDINTTWFGVTKEQDQPYLHYSNRLVDILRESQMGAFTERFPQLVSFVGQTGMSIVPVSRHMTDQA